MAKILMLSNQKLPHRIPKKNGGFSLIEVAIVLTVVGLIIGGIWIVAATVYDNNLRNTANKELIQIINNVQQYGGWSALAGGSEQGFVNMGLFPADMMTNYTNTCSVVGIAPPCPIDPWGGAVLISILSESFSNPSSSPSGSFTLNAGSAVIALLGLTPQSCTKFLMDVVPTLART